MVQTLRRIDPLSAAKISAVVYGLVGLLFAPFILLMSTMAPTDPSMPSFGKGLALAMPFLYAGGGFVFTLLGAALYNLIAGWIGGVEIELT